MQRGETRTSAVVSIGVVAKLWRYPVKSMLGEECAQLELERRGVRGDRLFAVRTADGRLGSGKNSGRLRQVDGLFGFGARYVGDCPELSFPDGRRLRGDDPQIDHELSRALGTRVSLARESQAPHFDACAVHIVSTASLAWLRSRLAGSRIDERRFRPNIVVATDGSGPVEQGWIGKLLRVGQGVRLQVVAPTERCRMTTLAQDDLPADPGILRCIAQEADLQFGVYAEVVEPGTIAGGDPVSLEA